MRIDKKIVKYMEKNNTTEVSDYKKMCEILHEEEKKRKSEKEKQYDVWRMYFKFHQIDNKRKFIIDGVLDEKTITENIKLQKEKIESLKIFERSKYRKHLVPILLYLLNEASEKELTISPLYLAQKCGFFSKKITEKREFNDYISYRNFIKESFENKANSDNNELAEKVKKKKYLQKKMSQNTFFNYRRKIQKNVFDVLENLLERLNEINIIDYEIISTGIDSHNNVYMELLPSEKKEYEAICSEARDSLRPEILKTTKRTGDITKIELKDFIYNKKLADIYNKKLEELMQDKFWFDIVIRQFKIKLKTSDENLFEEYNVPKSEEEFLTASINFNHYYATELKKLADKKITDIKKTYEKDIADNIINKNSLDKQYRFDKVEYYNKIEIIDLLVSMAYVIDPIKLD